MKLNEAIEVLKDYRKGDFVDDYKLCEAIDTVVAELEKPLPTNEDVETWNAAINAAAENALINHYFDGAHGCEYDINRESILKLKK